MRMVKDSTAFLNDYCHTSNAVCILLACYDTIIPEQYSFWKCGHWLVIAIYAILLFIIPSVYGAYKIGYLRVINMLFPQILSINCINVITWLQICLRLLLIHGEKNPSFLADKVNAPPNFSCARVVTATQIPSFLSIYFFLKSFIINSRSFSIIVLGLFLTLYHSFSPQENEKCLNIATTLLWISRN